MANRSRLVSIGARIAFWREQKQLSLRALAAKSGLYASQLHRFEHDAQDPRATELEAIAKALGLSMAEFYEAEARAS